jgi:lipopolysaccharide transport system permease protein
MSNVSAPTPTGAEFESGPQPVLILRPPRGWSPINAVEVWRFRDLLLTLAGRDLKLRYKQTALGVVWVILQPLMGALIFTLVFGQIARLPTEGKPPLLFFFAGLLGWNLFSAVLSRSSTCLTGNANLISKVFFPRLVLPLSTVGSALVDFGVSLGMMVVLWFWYKTAPGWGLLLLPVWTAVLLMIAMGIGLVAAALTVSYRDVQYVLPVIVNILQYASPIAYSAAYAATRMSASVKAIYFLNPLVGVMEAFRWSTLGTQRPGAGELTYSIAVGFAVFWIGAVAFKQMERKFADVI